MLEKLDSKIISTAKHCSIGAARVVLFIIFFWFGILKIFGLSPAGPMVHDLFDMTISVMSFSNFYLMFGLFEMLIGLLFITPRAERLAIFLLAIHMFTTSLPLFILPTTTWAGFLVPTLEGQYIIKNLLIIALAIGVAANLKPLTFRLN